MSDVPVFAVVGRVNKGKSSVIATLAEDDDVAISPIPGTTRRCIEHPVRIEGETVFVLVDTPGFEDAPRALAWLQAAAPAADARRARVVEFVTEHAGGDFEEERALLQPILDGALILYVVDGTKPYRDNYASEMEILRWTGQPSMALINRIGEGDHVDSWRSALDQYFKVVREFDAHGASFAERVRLLTTFRELAPAAEAPLQRAIDALVADRERRRADVADVITDLLIDALGFTMQTTAGDSARPRELERKFHDALREREQRARRDVEALYHHRRVAWDHADEFARPVFGEDLFARRTWTDLGLSASQVLALYTVSGAVAGSVVDAGLGGASFLTGTAIGSVVGAGAGVLHLQRRFARATSLDGWVDRAKGALQGGPRYRVGPFEHPNFPFVLLDRALLHFDAVRTRAHAKSAAGEAPAPLSSGGSLTKLSAGERQALHRLFRRVAKTRAEPPPPLRAELTQRITNLLPD